MASRPHPMLDLRHLRAFVTIAESGSITKAARRLAMAESPLGRQLKSLERDLGQNLFERRGRRLRLSAAGTDLLPRAQNLLGLAEDIRRDPRGGGGTDCSGTVRLGLVPGIAWHPALGRIVRGARSHHPGITLEMSVDATQFLVGGLRSGAHDLVLLRRHAAGGGLQSRLLCREELRLVVARSIGRMPVARLLELPWLEPAGRTPSALQAAIEAAGLTQRQRIAVPDLATAAAMARSGIGMLLTHASVADALNGVHTVAPPFPYPAQEIHLAWRGRATSPAADALMALIQREFAKNG